MAKQMTKRSDPVAATVERLTELGYADVRGAVVASAWRDVLLPELRDRIGGRLSSRLSASELKEFPAIADDDLRAMAWLMAHVPDYREVTREEEARLIDEAVAWFARALAAHTEGGV